jgi:CheY-like chemotaxis protein
MPHGHLPAAKVLLVDDEPASRLDLELMLRELGADLVCAASVGQALHEAEQVAAEQVSRVAAELAESDRRKAEFLATLAHELRNPLAPLRNGLHVLRLSRDQAARTRSWQMMDRQLPQMVHLIEQAGHALEVDLPAPPVWLSVDATRIAQVLTNLLSNAAKYTAAHGHIRLSAHCDGGDLVLVVRDNGIGMTAQSLPRVFEMFNLVSSPGQHPPGGRLNVLLVDDNVDAAESMALILQMDGHATRVASDGRKALEIAHDFKPQVVFLDIGMPGMDGYQVAKALPSQHAAHRPVLIALTGWGAKENRARTKAAGFDYHLTKPASIEVVEPLLESLHAAP